MVTGLLLLSSLLGAEQSAVASKTAKAKSYVVYVTVVEIDADGNELVLFTPKVQTTGNPAGVTIEHVDGRSFEFNCKMTKDNGPALAQPPASAANAPVAHKAEKPASRKTPASAPPATLNPAPDARPATDVARLEKPAPHSTRKAEEFYVRTYDVSDLMETTETATEAQFAALIQTVKTVAVPDSWSGKATIRPFTSTKSLVIKQNEAGHAAVADALRELRPRNLDENPN